MLQKLISDSYFKFTAQQIVLFLMKVTVNCDYHHYILSLSDLTLGHWTTRETQINSTYEKDKLLNLPYVAAGCGEYDVFIRLYE